MRMNRSSPRILAAFLLVLLLFFLLLLSVLPLSCGETIEGPVSTDDATRTLASLRKVDDYPLYVMRYYGDYGFDAYLGGAAARTYSAVEESALDWGCTTFAALGDGGRYLLGRNFDWQHHMALLVYTDPPDGHASVSLVDLSYLGFDPDDPSDANQRRLLPAPLWPFDGMNEKGVAVGMMAVPRADGGNDPRKRTIGTLAVIRLVLDYAGDVEEAVTLLSGYNVDFTGGPPVHYLVSDPGRSVVIEFVDAEMRVIRNDRDWQVATNFTMTGYVWNGDPSSCWRYNTAYRALEARGGVMNGEEAMDLLESVSQSNTMWSVVYGSGGAIAVSVGRDYAAVHEFSMDSLAGSR